MTILRPTTSEFRTSRTLRPASVRQALIAAVVVAGLSAGTVACGGQDSSDSADAAKREVVETLIDAARTSTSVPATSADSDSDAPVAAAPGTTFPTPNSPVIVNAPANPAERRPGVTTVPAPQAPATTQAPAPANPTPANQTPVNQTPGAAEVDDPAPAAVDPVAAPAPVDPAPAPVDPAPAPTPAPVPAPVLTLPFNPNTPTIGNLVLSPKIKEVKFWSAGRESYAEVIVDMRGLTNLSNITSVKFSYQVLGLTMTRTAIVIDEIAPGVWLFDTGRTPIVAGMKVTFTATNAHGLTDTLIVTANPTSVL